MPAATAPRRTTSGCKGLARRSVEPEVEDVALVGLELARLDALHDVGEGGVRRRGDAELPRLLDDEAVEELDLGAPALHHVLAHRGAVRATAARRLGEPALVVEAARLGIALAGARDHLWVDV